LGQRERKTTTIFASFVTEPSEITSDGTHLNEYIHTPAAVVVAVGEVGMPDRKVKRD